MIDTKKSLVIFSHPRSGSTWFQNSLKQYSLGELFNLNITIVSCEENIELNFDKHGYDLNTAEIELQRRFDIFNHFESIKGPVSVKIHTAILNQQMIDFLKTKDVQYIILDRLSKSDTFWSFLIAWNLHNWHDEILEKSITVTRQSFDRVIAVMSDINNSSQFVKDNFTTNTIHYEDLINMSDNNWFKSTERYKVINGKSKVTILNLKEVNDWLSSVGRQEWTMN
jgi:hypothetical protein